MLLEKRAKDVKARDKDFSSSQFADDTASYFDESKKDVKIPNDVTKTSQCKSVESKCLIKLSLKSSSDKLCMIRTLTIIKETKRNI